MPRALLLQSFYTIRSERPPMKQLGTFQIGACERARTTENQQRELADAAERHDWNVVRGARRRRRGRRPEQGIGSPDSMRSAKSVRAGDPDEP